MSEKFKMTTVDESKPLRRCKSDILPSNPIPILINCANYKAHLNGSDDVDNRIPPFPMNLKFYTKGKYRISLDTSPTKIQQLKINYKNTVYLIRKNFKNVFKILMAILITIFIIYACHYNFRKARNILIIFILYIVYVLASNIFFYYGKNIVNFFEPLNKFLIKHSKLIFGFMVSIFVGLFIVYIAVGMKKTTLNVLSIAGYFIFLVIMTIMSKSIRNINPRTVLFGLFFQMLISFVCCRLNIGITAIKSASDFVSNIINHSKHGALIIFSKQVMDMFVFKIFPPLVFFSALINLLYYIGIMGFITEKGATFMKIFLHITNVESVCIFANIFLGGIESSLLIKPYLPYVTQSELVVILAGGFSSIAGGILAVFISMGIPGIHLITSCLMSPFGTVALAKIIYPENKQHQKNLHNKEEKFKNKEENCLHAISEGAAAAIGLIAYIVVNLLAFYSIGHLVDSFLDYLCKLVSNNNLSLQIIFSYIFYPFAVFMGVETNDRFKISELLGTKLFVNELIAFEKLKQYAVANMITKRTEIIGTYALCSFANFATLGFTIGGMTVLAPDRAKEIAKLLPIAFCCGFMVSIFNATISGFMIDV